jgi:transposase
MMGVHQPQVELFSYKVNLDKRVRADHPLRRVAAEIDFTFIRAEVASAYGHNGHVSTDPAVLLKMMFLLFFDDVASERELMKIIPERLDYLWFLGYGIDDEIPDHSVLSKARARWGKDAFEKFFTRTITQCVQAGLVDGRKLHMDSSLLQADASKDSIVRSGPELIAALKAAYQAQESKLQESLTHHYEQVNDRVMSTTDPDASVIARKGEHARPRYHHHRAVDDVWGVITAVETTPGGIAENRKMMDLINQAEANTHRKVETAIADRKYGTADNYIACQNREIETHIANLLTQSKAERAGIISEIEFKYQPEKNSYLCPAGHELVPRRLNPKRRTMEYYLPGRVCMQCPLRKNCTRSKTYGRTLQRHEHQEVLERARRQAQSVRGRRDRRRRQTLMEGSFADAANNHGFKRARWRRLWRQQIQDWLIAGIQNIRTFLKATKKRTSGGATLIAVAFGGQKPVGGPFSEFPQAIEPRRRHDNFPCRIATRIAGPIFTTI